MTILKTLCRTASEFSDRYLAELPTGGLFIPTRLALAVGEPVVVSVRIGPRADPVLLRGSVAWRRPGKHSTKTKAGIGVEFLRSETQGRDYLLALARGDTSVASARRHQRLPIDLPMRWQVPGSAEDRPGVLRDIGRGGAFVRTDEPIQGTDVVLKVAPPGAEIAMPVSARIAWVAPGNDAGFGVSWRARDAGGSRRIKELVRRMERLADVDDAFVEPMRAAT
jgi:type IV pilus assembly protein PilZ